jgi:hypothetical protein
MHPRDLKRELVFACALTLGAALATGVLAPLQRHAGDRLVRLGANRAPEPPAGLPDVAVVTLDAQSLGAYPAWPATSTRVLDPREPAEELLWSRPPEVEELGAPER